MLELIIEFIYKCGYNSLTTKAPEDVLICYNDIILVHCKNHYRLDELLHRPVWLFG
jgi:hypothetical protein